MRIHVPVNVEPASSVAEAAAAYRRELSVEWLTPSQAGVLMGAPEDAADRRVKEERRAGRILGAWVAREHGYRYPPRQFRADGAPVPQMREILQLLREHGGVIDHGRRTSGWNEVEWFVTPHVLLQNLKPVEQLAEHAEQVLHAAYIEFVEE